MLHRAGGMKVIYGKETGSWVIYGVSKYCKLNIIWHVFVYEDEMEFKCSCLRMESLSIPCDHIIAVLVYLDISKLPKSLVLHRWTNNCKDTAEGINDNGGLAWDSLGVTRYECLIQWSKVVNTDAIRKACHFKKVLETLISLHEWIEKDNAQETAAADQVDDACEGFLRDPKCVRTKGWSNQVSWSSKGKLKHCGVCRRQGHNRTSYPV